jgi:hypothetical protein
LFEQVTVGGVQVDSVKTGFDGKARGGRVLVD